MQITRFQSDVSGFIVLPLYTQTNVTFEQSLAPYNTEYSIGVPTSNPQIVKLLSGGTYFSGPRHGTADVPYAWAHKGMVIASNKQEVENTYNALAVPTHTMGRLWRFTETRNEAHHVRAYYDSLEITRSHQGFFRFAEPWYAIDVTCNFQILSPLWNGRYHGGGITLDTGIGFDAGYGLDYVAANDQKVLAGNTTTWSYSVGGNRRQPRMSILISAGANPLTAITVNNTSTGTAFTWTGFLAAYNDLLIDTARPAVEQLATLTTIIGPSATTLQVDSSAEATVGGAISIILFDGTLWTTTVASIPNSTSITVPQPGAPRLAYVGARVGFGAYFSPTNTRQFTPTRQEWFALAPHAPNELIITRTGGGATSKIGFSFYEAVV